MPPRTYEEAIRFDSELMRLSEEIVNLESWAGRNPSEATLDRIARLQQKLEYRHEAIRRKIEEERRSAETESLEADFNSNPIANSFESFLLSLGKEFRTAKILKNFFLDRDALALQSDDIKIRMRQYLNAFSQALFEEDRSKEELARYSAAINEVLMVARNVTTQIDVFDSDGDSGQDDATLYSLSDEFLEAARVLKATSPTRVGFYSAVYYLLGHSAELMLKAFLYTRGFGIGELRDLNHDLRALVKFAQGNGLAEKASVGEILKLADAYKNKRFEYRIRKKNRLPSLDLLIKEMERLQSDVFGAISAKGHP